MDRSPPERRTTSGRGQRRRRTAAAVAMLATAALLVGGCGSGALQTGAPPKSVSPASSTEIFDCSGKAHSAPVALVLACADAGDELLDLHWHGWGAASASASGTEAIQTCVPTCVAGGVRRYPVRVRVSRLALEGTRTAYGRLTVDRFTARRRRVAAYSLSATGPAFRSGTP